MKKRKAITVNQIVGGLMVIFLLQLAVFGLAFYAYWQMEKYLPVSLGYLDALFKAVAEAQNLYDDLSITYLGLARLFERLSGDFANTTRNVLQNEQELVPCFETWHGGCD